MNYIPHLSMFAITFLAGLVAYLVQKKLDQSIKLFLAFSGAFLLATCVIHLLPEVFEHQELQVAPFILIGFFIQVLIEYLSQGLEHGHIHGVQQAAKFPIFIYLGLCFHAFTEGLPLSDMNFANMMSSPLYWGILLHKLPIVIVLISLLSAHQANHFVTLLGLLVFSSLAPLGGLLGHYINGFSDSNLIPYFLAISTGIFLHISTIILFETSHNHRFNFIKFLFILLGGLLAVFLF